MMVTMTTVISIAIIVTTTSGLRHNRIIKSVSTISQNSNRIEFSENEKAGPKVPQFMDNFNGTMEDIEAEFEKGQATGYAHLHIRKLSAIYGYPLRKYKAVTEDGYKLVMYRIRREGPAVFLVHGLLGSCDDYMTSGPESSLAYLLADAGYDVWMGNVRGSKHSRRHATLNPSSSEYWDFSWHEIGIYDLPAMIDLVLKITGQDSLAYVGQSQGSTSFYVMASERPEYNSKVALAISLAPVAYMSHLTSPFLRMLAGPANAAYPMVKHMGINEFLPDSAFTHMLTSMLCGSGAMATVFCSNLLFMTLGFSYAQLNITNLPVIYGHVPAGSSTKQIVHYAQGITSGQFRQFDYGPAENQRRYGSAEPPRYKLENIIAPMSLFYSDADWVSHPVDVERLRSELPNVVDYYKVPFYPFNHVDYMWAKDLKKLVYEHMDDVLNAHYTPTISN